MNCIPLETHQSIEEQPLEIGASSFDSLNVVKNADLTSDSLGIRSSVVGGSDTIGYNSTLLIVF